MGRHGCDIFCCCVFAPPVLLSHALARASTPWLKRVAAMAWRVDGVGGEYSQRGPDAAEAAPRRWRRGGESSQKGTNGHWIKTAPRWHSSRASGLDCAGDQSEQTPLPWPIHKTAVCGFCANDRGAPAFVLCSATNWPVETSLYLSQPAWPADANKKWNGR